MSTSAGFKDRKERLFPGQHEDEQVELVFRQHPLVMRKQLVVGMLLLVLAAVPFDFPFAFSSPDVTHWLLIGALVIVAGTLFMWFHRWVGWYYSIYIVTNRRIVAIKQKGFFNRRVDEWQLNNISNVNYEIGGFQAVLFGRGGGGSTAPVD
jgi:hypothetical protein